MQGVWLNKLWCVHTVETIQSLRRVSRTWTSKPVMRSRDILRVKEAGHGVVSFIGSQSDFKNPQTRGMPGCVAYHMVLKDTYQTEHSDDALRRAILSNLRRAFLFLFCILLSYFRFFYNEHI